MKKRSGSAYEEAHGEIRRCTPPGPYMMAQVIASTAPPAVNGAEFVERPGRLLRRLYGRCVRRIQQHVVEPRLPGGDRRPGRRHAVGRSRGTFDEVSQFWSKTPRACRTRCSHRTTGGSDREAFPTPLRPAASGGSFGLHARWRDGVRRSLRSGPAGGIDRGRAGGGRRPCFGSSPTVVSRGPPPVRQDVPVTSERLSACLDVPSLEPVSQPDTLEDMRSPHTSGGTWVEVLGPHPPRRRVGRRAGLLARVGIESGPTDTSDLSGGNASSGRRGARRQKFLLLSAAGLSAAERKPCGRRSRTSHVGCRSCSSNTTCPSP